LKEQSFSRRQSGRVQLWERDYKEGGALFAEGVL
jgi:hypothetical protein